MDLHERLTEANLASGNIYYGDEHVADRAVAVVVAWLRDEADEIEQSDLKREGRLRYGAEYAATTLRDLADSITGSTDAPH